MQYTFSLTPRMVTLAVVCLVSLCVLLFLAGMEIGQKMTGQTIMPSALDVSKVIPVVKAPKIPTPDELISPLVPAKP
jgi:hypothetical protein